MNYFLPLLFFLSIECYAQVPPPRGWINDYENILKPTEEKVLDSIVKTYYKNTKREIAVVTQDSIFPYPDVSEYCLALFRSWGIGKERQNGLLIFVSAKLYEAHITAGDQTKLVLNTGICREIIQKYMVPHLREKRYYIGIRSGLLEVIRRWK